MFLQKRLLQSFGNVGNTPLSMLMLKILSDIAFVVKIYMTSSNSSSFGVIPQQHHNSFQLSLHQMYLNRFHVWLCHKSHRYQSQTISLKLNAAPVQKEEGDLQKRKTQESYPSMVPLKEKKKLYQVLQRAVVTTFWCKLPFSVCETKYTRFPKAIVILYGKRLEALVCFTRTTCKLKISTFDFKDISLPAFGKKNSGFGRTFT